MQQPIRLAILGAGGLGKGMINRANQTPDFTVVGIVDREAYLYDAEGIDYNEVADFTDLKQHTHAIASPQAMLDLFKTHGDQIDAVFVALPNLPVGFIPQTATQLSQQTPFKGVMVDALKRTKAVELMLEQSDALQREGVLYITGAGATPGFLSTVAAVAAQSFVEVEKVEIKFGVGIANWNSYRATVREDFLHLEGFDAERVAAMSDEEIEAELDKRNGLIELVNMEHADDIILELAGICPRENVVVGGLVDTRNAKKPISTQVIITGRTTAGAIGSHVLTLDDATTMVDNVCGPALGFLRQGIRMHQRGLVGVVTSADLIPRGPVESKIKTPILN